MRLRCDPGQASATSRDIRATSRHTTCAFLTAHSLGVATALGSALRDPRHYEQALTLDQSPRVEIGHWICPAARRPDSINHFRPVNRVGRLFSFFRFPSTEQRQPVTNAPSLTTYPNCLCVLPSAQYAKSACFPLVVTEVGANFSASRAFSWSWAWYEHTHWTHTQTPRGLVRPQRLTANLTARAHFGLIISPMSAEPTYVV